MIDVLVEAGSPDLYAEIADLLRDHSQIRVIEGQPDAREGNGESEGRPQLGVVVAVPEAGRESLESLRWNQDDWNAGGWSAAGVPVILLVESPARWISAALPPGVRAVLPRNVTPAEIVGAIEAVAAGLYVFHPADLDSIPPFRSPEPGAAPAVAEPLVEHLTAREIEVLQLLSEGLGNKEIASRLNISEHTAKFHVASIMGKLGATSRTEAVTLGIRRGLLMI